MQKSVKVSEQDISDTSDTGAANLEAMDLKAADKESDGVLGSDRVRIVSKDVDFDKDMNQDNYIQKDASDSVPGSVQENFHTKDEDLSGTLNSPSIKERSSTDANTYITDSYTSSNAGSEDYISPPREDLDAEGFRLDGGPANKDPITGEHGSHPLGVGIGGSVGAAGVGALAGAVAGPPGALIGAAVGAIVGAVTGKDAAEAVNPTEEYAQEGSADGYVEYGPE